MGKYMNNESLDIMISAIVDKAIEEYKNNLKERIVQHYNNPYCAKTDIGNVMYQKDIMDIIDQTPL